MWNCPGCGSEVDDDFELCWNCGTAVDGTQDPNFVSADDAGPIHDEALDLEDALADAPDAELAEGLPDLVPCYEAQEDIEAKFVADQLRLNGIPAVADRQNINMVLGGYKPQLWGAGPCVRVRPEDLTRALTWVEGYRLTRAERKQRKLSYPDADE